MFFFSSRRRHTRLQGDWSSDVCSSDLYRLAIGLRVGIDKIVQRIALLVGRKTDVAAVGEENAIGVVRAEEEVTLGGILPGFGSIHRNPADADEMEFGPAMVARDVTFGLAFGQRKTDFETSGNARRTHHADE